MNDETSVQLKILVERVVRPLVVTRGRKRQLREELLAHVSGVYESELARAGDVAAALAATRGRFGDPGELAAQLQSDASRRERYGVFMERISWQAGEPVVRGAAKLALSMAASFLSCIFAVLVVKIFLRKPLDVAAATRLFLMLAIVAGAWTFGLVWFAERIASWLFSEPPTRRRALGTLWLAISLTFPPALAFSVFWGATGDLGGSLRHAAFACLFAPVAPVLFVLVGRDLASHLRYQREWDALVIDE